MPEKVVIEPSKPIHPAKQAKYAGHNSPSVMCSRRAQEPPLPWETNGRSLRRGGGHRRLPPRKDGPRRRGARTGAGRAGKAELVLPPPGGKGPRSAAEWSAPWKRSFCASRQDRNKTVSCRCHRNRVLHSRCLWLRPGRHQRRLQPGRDRALALLVVTPLPPPFGRLRRRSAARAAPARSPPARSGSECLRRPPQIRPQPTHPVRQNTAWHTEVNGDVGVMPAVYYQALQQPAVVCPQIPEEGAESVTTRGSHWGDLGHVIGISVVGLIAGHRAVMAPGVPGTSLPSRSRPALEVPGNTSKPNETPRIYQDGPTSWPRWRVPGGWGFRGILSGRGWGLSAA
jgi:hypothetical protein